MHTKPLIILLRMILRNSLLKTASLVKCLDKAKWALRHSVGVPPSRREVGVYDWIGRGTRIDRIEGVRIPNARADIVLEEPL